MNKTKSIEFMDFTFGDTKLSSLGWYVGGTDSGVKTYSVLPSRTYITDSSIGMNGETVYASKLDPRPFEVTIVKEDIEDGDIRRLAAWLNTPEPKKFSYVGDDRYINACLDSQAFDVEALGVSAGQIPLKFIAHNPLYYSNDKVSNYITQLESNVKYVCKDNSTTENTSVFISVACNGNLTINVYDKDNKLLSTSNITDVVGGVDIYIETQDAVLLSGASHFHKIDKFPQFPVNGGDFKVSFVGNELTGALIEYSEIFI
jgi:phage-related protein